MEVFCVYPRVRAGDCEGSIDIHLSFSLSPPIVLARRDWSDRSHSNRSESIPLCPPSSAQIILMNLDECVFDCHQPSPLKAFSSFFSHYTIEISFNLKKYFLFSALISERVVSWYRSYRIIINHCTSKTDYVNFLCYLARAVITSSLYAGYSRWISSTTLTNCN